MLTEWSAARSGATPPMVALNLGDASVTDGGILGVIRAEFAAARLSPRALCFEVGESAVVAHPAASGRFLHDLRAAGCRVALERCGTGMAAFTLLRRLPLDYLKIAGHLVRGMARDPIDRALVTAVNQVGHLMHLRTVGVEAEDAEAVAWLRRLGVDFAPEFGVARPEPLEVALERLEPSSATP